MASAIALFAALPTAAAFGDPAPETTTYLGGQVGFARFAVDSVHGHVFVSEPNAGAVAVLDSSGHLVTTISGLPGAYGLAIGGNYLYVAAESAGDVDRINLGSPESAQTFVTGLTNPQWLGFAGGRLWIATSAASDGNTTIIGVDPATGTQQSFGGSFAGADFASSPADPNALYMAEADETSEPLHRYDVTTFPPRETAYVPFSWGSAWGNMALSADGSRLEMAASNGLQELCSQTLHTDNIIYSTNSVEAVATSASGLLATGFRVYTYPDVSLYRVGVPAPFWSTTTSASDNLEYGGLALSADGSTLYAAVVGPGVGNEGVVIETYALPPAPSQPGVAGSCPLPSGGSNGGATSGGSPGTGTTTVSVHHSGRAIFGRLRVRLPRHALRPSAAFLLKIALRPAQRGRAGYRYRLELTRLRCADGATEIAIDFGNRDVTMSCKAHTKRLHGLIRLASRYVVHVRATSVRGHRRMALGAIYSLALQAR